MTPENASNSAQDRSADRRPRRLALFASIRTRILFWYVVLMAVAIGAAVLVVRQVLLAQVEARINESLEQEAEELRRLAGGLDPRTGEPFDDDVERLFEVFLDRNIPVRNEAYVTFVNGRPFRHRSTGGPYALHRDLDLAARWSRVTVVQNGTASTPAGPIDYLAVPVKDRGRTLGVFVAAFFRDPETEQIELAVRGAGIVGLATLLVGSLLAWRVAEGVLRPVRTVTSTARTLTTEDLTRRIAVQGHDEISTLAQTFNEMLDKLEEAFRSQRRFVDDAGHELRTPITVIRGHLELLEDDPVERRRTLALVSDELDRMQRIVDDLLTLAKAEQPDFLSLETVDLRRLTQDVHAKVQALADRDWRIDDMGRGIIVGDRQRLTQAVMQLAQNAVQHSAEGSRVAIGSALRDGEARLWVRDEGQGISPEDQERIFRRFSRGTRRSSEGAGLGLAIVRAIAEAHHGSVEIESREGRGSTFTLVLPTDQPEEAARR